MCRISVVFFRRTVVLPDWFLEKYDVTLFLRFFALPTYIITPEESINWYTPGLSGIRERITLKFASAAIIAGRYYANIMNVAVQHVGSCHGMTLPGGDALFAYLNVSRGTETVWV
jgi:hypothetical protein